MADLSTPAKAGNTFAMPLIVDEGRINRREIWRLELKAYRDKHYFDLRRWYADDDDIARPSHKGLSLSVDHLAAIAAAFVEAATMTDPGEP